MHGQLATGGYLLLGASETTYNLSDDYDRSWTAGPLGTGHARPRRRGRQIGGTTMEFSTEALGQIVTDIWTSMLGFPVEARGEPMDVNGTRHLSASVQISGGWEGTVLVSCPEALAQRVAGVMFDTPEASDDEIRDALGEVANMTAGNVKALVESYCRLSLPMVAEGRELAISIPGSKVVAQANFDCGEDPLSVEVFEKA